MTTEDDTLDAICTISVRPTTLPDGSDGLHVSLGLLGETLTNEPSLVIAALGIAKAAIEDRLNALMARSPSDAIN